MSDPTNPRADELDLLLNRVAELEVRNEKLRRLSVWTILGVAAVLGIGVALVVVGGRRGLPGTVSRSIESQSFMVRDASGKVRGAWGVAADGSLRFSIQDARGKAGVTQAVEPEHRPRLTACVGRGDDAAGCVHDHDRFRARSQERLELALQAIDEDVGADHAE